MTRPPTPVVFVDRDGTLVLEPPDEQVDRLEKIKLVPNVVSSLIRLVDAGFVLVMISNQDGLGTESFPRDAFDLCQSFIVDLFASQGITFDAVLVCPHTSGDGCECRKPKTALVDAYLARADVDRARSAVVGDRPTDVELGERLGIRAYRVDPTARSSWPDITARILAAARSGAVRRTTRETDVSARIELGAGGQNRIATGIGFLDHMLDQIATHGGFSLELACVGDLHVDEHHTVEDTAIAMGQALREALGDRRGAGRFGFVAPMDEAEARVSLDLSGRSFFKFEGVFSRERVGELPTELVPHFFRSLADALGATLHIEVRGENAHHMIESCFKGVGRALRDATRIEGSRVPSTKGVL